MYCGGRVAKAVALVGGVGQRATAGKPKRPLKAVHKGNLDQTVNSRIEGDSTRIFGADRQMRIRLTRAEHKEF